MDDRLGLGEYGDKQRKESEPEKKMTPGRRWGVNNVRRARGVRAADLYDKRETEKAARDFNDNQKRLKKEAEQRRKGSGSMLSGGSGKSASKSSSSRGTGKSMLSGGSGSSRSSSKKSGGSPRGKKLY